MAQDTLTIVALLPDGVSASDAQRYASEWQSRAESATRGHIWHVDPLQWTALDPAVDEPWQPDESHRSKKPYVMVNMVFGEAIEVRRRVNCSIGRPAHPDIIMYSPSLLSYRTSGWL